MISPPLDVLKLALYMSVRSARASIDVENLTVLTGIFRTGMLGVEVEGIRDHGG